MKKLEKEIQIDFKNKNIESDQGPSLLAICKDFNCLHFGCIRLFFAGLKWSKYSYEISKLVTYIIVNLMNVCITIIIIKNKKTIKKLNRKEYDELEREMTFYETDEEKCQCSGNKLESQIYDLDIPSVHRLAIVAT